MAEMEAMEGGGLTADETKPSNKAKQTSIGRKKFNMDPKKGIEYLIEHNLLAPTPEDVAQFLYKGEGLNKTAIGDYLGERHDFNERVLRAFVELHDFTDLILVQALRQFLWSFRLPGEAQKIDRMMECFAQRYCQLNPNIFTNTDTCYVLSFAIIMLNTSLHNPSVKDKPSVEQFISMNRGINNGGDLPRELLVVGVRLHATHRDSPRATLSRLPVEGSKYRLTCPLCALGRAQSVLCGGRRSVFFYGVVFSPLFFFNVIA